MQEMEDDFSNGIDFRSVNRADLYLIHPEIVLNMDGSLFWDPDPLLISL
jgi:hypothetical protein